MPNGFFKRPHTGGASIRRQILATRGAGLALLVTLLLSGCSEGVLDPQGPVAAAERLILFNSLAIMLAIAVPTIIATLCVAWWFRASNTRARYRPDWEFSGRIEMIVWSIPAMTVLLLGGIAWIGSHDLDPPKPLVSTKPPINIQVVSLDWKWLFIYPDQGIASVNRLVVPAGTPISFQLTSSTVMNSFFVPQLGTQIYTMAGMTTRLHLKADRPGRYPGLSAQFSGDGFSGMHFNVDATTPQDFDAFVDQARANGEMLDGAAYQRLQQPSSYVAPMTYRAITSGLFNSIVAMTPPAAAPAAPAPSDPTKRI